MVSTVYYENIHVNLLCFWVFYGLDVNTNGTLDLASMDRISESSSYYEKDASNNYWQVSVSKLYPNDNSAVVVTNSIQKTQLTGLGISTAHGLLSSVNSSTDLLGNSTVAFTTIDSSNKTVTATVDYPDSTNNQSQITINGLLVQSTTKTGHTYGFSYDAFGRRLSATDPRTGVSTTHYNDAGQVDWVEDAAGSRTVVAYDPATGRSISTTDALSNTVYTAYNVEGQVIGTWGATYPVFYEFDEFDRMSGMYTLRDTNLAVTGYSSFSSQPSAFDKTTWQYDEATGLLTNKLYADGKGISYSYTPDGKLAARTWARGAETLYYYDPLNQMTSIQYQASSIVTPSITFTYDRLGRQVSVIDAQGSRTFAYDPATLALVSESVTEYGRTNIITRTQDTLGRSSGLSVAGVGDLSIIRISHTREVRFFSFLYHYI